METTRKWYQKKRYIIPIGLVGLLSVVSVFGNHQPPTPTTASQKSESKVQQQPVQINPPAIQNSTTEITPTPATSLPEVQDEPKIKEPQPSPTPVPKPTPPPPPPAIETPKSNCDPNYSGCVPIATDVDCAGGSGNGPAYVKGPIRVIGSDIYKLDTDHDGIACE